MARLFPHPQVENYFREVDVTDPAAAATVVGAYEAGQAIVLKNARLEYDAPLVAATEFPATPEYKKFKGHRFQRDFFDKGKVDGDLLDRCFGGDRGRLAAFAQQLRSVNEQLRALATRLFPRYRRLTDSVTWRLSETVNENLHVDSYKFDLPDHHLRFFVNVDLLPRIWHTSWRLDHLLDHELHRLDPEFVRTASPGRVLHELNVAVFGAWAEAGREGAPKHIAFFDPGDVWVVDSRQVSHQIFWGRRAVSTDFQVEIASMDDPSRHYFAQLERRRGAARPAGGAAGASAAARGA